MIPHKDALEDVSRVGGTWRRIKCGLGQVQNYSPVCQTAQDVNELASDNPEPFLEVERHCALSCVRPQETRFLLLGLSDDFCEQAGSVTASLKWMEYGGAPESECTVVFERWLWAFGWPTTGTTDNKVITHVNDKMAGMAISI